MLSTLELAATGVRAATEHLLALGHSAARQVSGRLAGSNAAAESRDGRRPSNRRAVLVEREARATRRAPESAPGVGTRGQQEGPGRL